LEVQAGRIVIRDLFARIDQGTARASGSIDLGDDYLPRAFDVRVDGRDVAVFSPEYIAQVTMAATIKGATRDDTIRARVDIADGARVSIDQSDRTLPSTEPLADVVYVDATARRQRTSQVDSAVPRMEIAITAPGGIRVTGEELDMLVQPRPRIVIVVDNGELVSVSGSLNAVSGQVVLFDQRYQIRYGTVQFDNQVPANP